MEHQSELEGEGQKAVQIDPVNIPGREVGSLERLVLGRQGRVQSEN